MTKFHIDRRIPAILAGWDASDDDVTETTREHAAFLGLSPEWLEVGRVRGYGPPFFKLSPRMVRYRRGTTREWLQARMHFSTSEYAEEIPRGRKRGRKARGVEAA